MVEIGFYSLTLLVIFIFFATISYVYKKENETVQQIRKRQIRFLLFAAAWFSYTAIIAYSGILDSLDLPPRMPLLLVIPIIAFGNYFIRKHATPYLTHLPKSFVFYFQGFRIIVELLIHGMFLKQLLPVQVTFEGYNFEIIASLLCVISGLSVFKYKALPIKAAIITNYIGLFFLATVFALFITTFYFSHLWGNEILPEGIFMMPYILLPSILFPAAVYWHLFSIKQLKSY